MTDVVHGGCSVEFSKFCRCKSLFEPKYLRTHRAGGTKVLRCFPHCCPGHVYSSVCGSSIVVRVHGPVSKLQDVVTYLRFEASYETPLAVGDVIDENTVLGSLRRQTHCVGEWIASHFEVIDEKMSSRVCEFNPKSQSTLGWHYRWVGGSALQQRRAVHHLRAYVFAREPPRLRVVATVQSTPFIVMSYRRACKACQRQTPEDERAGLQCQCEGVYRLAGSALSDENRSPQRSPSIATTASIPKAMTPPRCDERMEDALATIHYFVSNFPASVISSYLDSLDSMLRRTVDPPISHPILHQIHAHSTIASEKIVTWSQTLEALSVVLGFSTQVTPFLHSFSAAHVASLLDKDQLERSYATFVHHIYTNLARVLEPLNMTPHALADDMLTLCAVLHTEHPIAATTCLEKCRTFHPSLAFEAFVAHMREIYMSFNAPPQAVPVPTNRPLEGVWRYRSVSIMHISPQLCPSILSLMRACYMGLTFQIIQTSTSLFMRSHHSLTQKMWSEFNLNGIPQVHRVFPNGETTMACVDGLIHGDYVAELVDDSVVVLTLFSWPANATSRMCYAIHIHMARVGETSLALDVRVVAAPEVAFVQDYWCMTANERVARYDERNKRPVVAFQIAYDKLPHD